MKDLLYWPGWIELTVLACWGGLLIAASFAIRYHCVTGGHWHANPEGRWTMYRRLAEVSILGLTLINWYFPGWPGMAVLSFAVMLGYAAQTLIPHRLLSLRQREARQREQVPQ